MYTRVDDHKPWRLGATLCGRRHATEETQLFHPDEFGGVVEVTNAKGGKELGAVMLVWRSDSDRKAADIFTLSELRDYIALTNGPAFFPHEELRDAWHTAKYALAMMPDVVPAPLLEAGKRNLEQEKSFGPIRRAPETHYG